MALIIFSFSCSESSPEINQIFWQITKFHDIENNIFYDRLSVFLEVYDEDGVEDIRTIYVIHDNEELFWKINEDNWVFKTFNNENWFGSNNIVMNDFSGFPFGRYRVIVIDDAGERAETTFTISSYDRRFNVNHFPSAVIENNVIIFSANTEIAWFYNQDMRFMSGMNLENIEHRTATFPANASIMFLYRFDRAGGFGLMSGPYRVERP
ncbi:MAG: hypothetical protein FWC36_05260 [Spirochaetes bacterium]|nr:hypothetical protein [Spirochaetota bacterium]